jgi:hypothetical protein
MYIGLHVKWPLFFPIFMKIEISRQILEISYNKNLKKVRPVAAKLFHADRQTGLHDEGNSVGVLYF